LGYGTGHPTGIPLWGDGEGETFNIVTHTITYWVTDCHGNSSEPVERTITIYPRPKITKITEP